MLKKFYLLSLQIIILSLSKYYLFKNFELTFILINFSYFFIFLSIYYFYKKFSRVYYLSRKLFTQEFQNLGISIIIFILFSLFLFFAISLKEIPFSPLFFSLLVIDFITINLKYILASLIIILINFNLIKFKNLKLAKKFHPHHKFFRTAWDKETKAHINAYLISLEPEALHFEPTLNKIIMIWVQNGIISPLTFINLKNREEYLFLHENINNSKKLIVPNTIDIEDFKIEKHKITIKMTTNGKISLESFLNINAKNKIYEMFSQEQKLVRSISIDKHQKTLLIQFFNLNNLKFKKEIIDIIHRIEIAFTELKIFNHLNLFPELNKIEVLDQDLKNKDIYSIKINYQLPTGLLTETFTKKIKEFSAYVRRPFYEHKIKPYQDQIDLFIELKKRDLSLLRYTDFTPAEGLRIPIGFDLKYRKPVHLNFNQTNLKKEDPGITPHLLIAGSTGSGKSCFIKYLIMQLLRGHTPDTLRLFLVDPKYVGFSIFKKTPFLYAPIISDAEKFKLVLEGIREEVEKRYKLLAKYDAENIDHLEKLAPEEAKNLPKIIVIIDEFADIIDSHSWKVKEEINLLLKRLGQKARASGVHLILITQKATSTNIDSEIKTNLSGRISFKVASENDSYVILNREDAYFIENTGEAFALLGETEELTNFQFPYITEKEFYYELNKLKKYPFYYYNQSLSQELLKQPLNIEDVKPENLPTPFFPDIPVGINLKSHKIHFIRFEESKHKKEIEPTPHLIIVGATNTGKSKFAKVILNQLILAGGPDLIQIILVDPKHVTFRKFYQAPQLTCPIITKHHLLLPVLENLLEEIEERYKLFAKHNLENITEYREKIGKIPSYFVIIDEFADLLDSYSYKDREKIEKTLKRYGQMARAAGVHLIIITQKASSENLPSEIKSNIAGRISFRVNSSSDSYYILEEEGAEKIKHAGIFLMKANDEEVKEAYAPLFHGYDFEKSIKIAQEKWGYPQFKQIAEIVVKEPLDIKAVTEDNLPLTTFPDIPIGINLETHKIQKIRFERISNNEDEEPVPHLMIVGATNSGKSVFAKLLIYELIKDNPPETVRLILIDPKQVSFTKFKSDPHLMCPIIKKHHLLLPTLEKVLKIIEERYELFSEQEVENIGEYREKTGQNLESIFLFIDEFADLLDSYEYRDRSKIEQILKRYGQMARAAGVHLIIITQKASSSNIPSEIRTNIAGRISFRVNTSTDSYYILEEEGAEKIKNTGMFLIRKNHEEVEKAYAPLIHGNDIDYLINKNNLKYGKVNYLLNLEEEEEEN
jgi:DNA segregation ATPase FtsK/SpoIIIE-like protein